MADTSAAPHAIAGMTLSRDGNLLDPRAVLTSIGVALYDWNLDSDRIDWGGNAADVLGVADMSPWASGDEFGAVSEPDRTVALRDAIARSSERDRGAGVPYALAYTLSLEGAPMRTVEETGRWFSDGEGRPASVHGMIRLVQQPAGSAPDGSGERAAFLADLARDIAASLRSKTPISAVVAAIDDLAGLNDAFGFDAADLVLDAMCDRLQRTMRRRDAFARYSGNRFALALRACPPDEIATAVDRISGLIAAEPIRIGSHEVRPRLIFGAASAPVHASEAPSLLRCAEQALLAAKRRGHAPLVVYDPARARARDRQPAGEVLDVVQLLNGRRIAIACQPVVEAVSRQVAFSEALLRVRNADGRIVTAADIVPLVERAGLIPLVDIRVVELAAEHLWRNREARLSINVSPRSLEGSDWSAALAANLGKHGDVASRLIVEVTETAAMQDPDAVRRRLDAVKSLGIGVAIDDFGSGHTSFRHLRSFPVDIVKMDGAFVQNLARAHDDRFFVRTLVDLAHHLGLPIVAEWVEDETTAALLASWGVDYLQGDHCGRPILAEPEAAETRCGTALVA